MAMMPDDLCHPSNTKHTFLVDKKKLVSVHVINFRFSMFSLHYMHNGNHLAGALSITEFEVTERQSVVILNVYYCTTFVHCCSPVIGPHTQA